MMRNKNNFILFIVSILFIAGCNPVGYIDTETLEPAEIAIPQKINSGVLILREPANEFKEVSDENISSGIMDEIKYGLADVLVNSPRFNSDQIVIPDEEDVNNFLKKDTLSWLDMKKITDKFNVDAVIIMDKIHFDSNLKDDYITKSGIIYYYLKFQITSNAHWKLYYPYQDLIIDEFTYSEKFVWESLDYDRETAISMLPEYSKTFREAAYWTGYDYGKRILPTWKQTSRSYYARGTKVLKEGSEMVDSNNWEQAIEIWKKNLKHTDREVVSRAAFNIAFAYEMMGDINPALKWAKKSLEIKDKPRTREYVEILKQRKENMQKLSKQIQ